MDEIIELYCSQLSQYISIKSILLEIRSAASGELNYELKLQDIDYIMDNIRKLNERGEQLKQIYILKHNLPDFTGDNIRGVETSEKYEKLKSAVDKITEEIKNVKKLQDEVINRINKEADETWNKLKEFNIHRHSFDKYDKSKNHKASKLIDVKK